MFAEWLKLEMIHLLMYQLPVVLLEILKLAYFEHVSILIIRRVVEQLRNLFIFVGRNLPIRFLNFLCFLFFGFMSFNLFYIGLVAAYCVF